MIVCVQTSNEGQRAHALSASLSLSLPTKAVHTMVFQGTSTPSIPPSIHPARISSQPSRLPESSSSPPKSATAAPDGNFESCLPFFSSTPTVLASAPQCDRSLRRGSGGSLGTYLTVPLSRSIGRTPRSWSCGTRAGGLGFYTQEKIRPRTTGRWIHFLWLGRIGRNRVSGCSQNMCGSENRKALWSCPALWFKG